MKPTSIIFLIVAAALILCGTVTCAVASAQAKAQDIALFENSDADGNYVAQYAVTGSSVNRIDLRLSEATVNIIGGAQSSYIEMYNFPTNSYRYSQTGGAVSLADSVDFTDLTSIFTLLSDGLKFDGMRQYFRFNSDNEREKIVNVYLSNTEAVKRLDITLGTGQIIMKGCNVAADFNLKINSGDCTVTESNGFSALNADIERGNFSYDGDLANGALRATLGTGNAQVRASRLNSRNVELVCNEGVVSYDGSERGSSYCPPKLDVSTASLQITAYRGNITVSFVGEFSPVNPDAPVTDTPATDVPTDTAEPAPAA